MKKVVSTLIILSMIAVPIIILAEDAGDACMQAQSAAKQDANGILWFTLGLLIGGVATPLAGIIATIVGYNLTATPPASALLGKSPEYVAAYTDCYSREVKKLRGNNTLYGCLTATGAYVVVGGCLLLSSIAYY